MTTVTAIAEDDVFKMRRREGDAFFFKLPDTRRRPGIDDLSRDRRPLTRTAAGQSAPESIMRLGITNTCSVKSG
jgi:hypothetical protein